MSRKALILTAAFAGFAMIAGTAEAATFTWNGNVSNSWNNASNWTSAGIGTPGPNDDVVIPSVGTNNPQLDVSVTINSLNVQNGGVLTFGAFTLTIDDSTLDIDSGGLVNINNGSGKIVLQAATTHPIDGELRLSQSNATLEVQESLTISGDGKVEGQNANALITIASGKTLTSTMAAASGGVRGFMQITGAGSFANNGRVEAVGGVLELANSLTGVSDTSSTNLWVVASDANSELKFSKVATLLEGDFILSKKLNVVANVYTCGGLTYNTGASIDVTSTSFRYLDYDGGTCSGGNPNDTTASGCNATVFVVNMDKNACP